MTDCNIQLNGAEIVSPCDMPEHIATMIVDIASQAATHFDVDKQGTSAAEFIKKRLDDELEPHWHVIIGNSFGSHVVHDSLRYVFFKLKGRSYLIYKSGSGPKPRKVESK